MSPSSGGIKAKTLKGLVWVAGQQSLSQLILVLTGILLMRVLSPEEFGLVAMVNVVSNFLSNFSNLGINKSLIYKEELREIDYKVVFTLMNIIGFSLALILFLLSPFIANFYEEPEVAYLSKVLSVTFILAALSSTPTALLKKQMKFRPIAIASTISVAISSIVALLLAYQGFGVWSLVFQAVINGLINAILILIRTGFPKGLSLQKQVLNEHLKFGLPLFASRTFAFFSQNSDKLLIGKILGAGDLGLYSRSNNLLLLPVRRLSTIITSVMFSTYSSIRDEKEKIGKTYLEMSGLLMYLCFTIFSVYVVFADFLVILALGEKWQGIIDLTRIFSLLIVINIPILLKGNVILSQGHTKLEFVFTIIGAILDILFVIIGLNFGLIYVTLGLLFSSILKLCLVSHLLNKIIHLEKIKLFRALFPPLFMFFISSSLLWALRVLDQYLNIWIIIIISFCVASLISIVMMTIFNSSLLKTLKTIIQSRNIS